MRSTILTLLVLAFALPVSAEPIPLEIYNATTPEAAADCRAAGFNTLVVRSRDDLDLCQRLGMKGVFGAIPHKNDKVDRKAIAERVREVMDHPALEGYILIDEPDLRPWSAPPSLIAELTEAVRKVDDSKPIAATLNGFLGAKALTNYLGPLDTIRLDPYPFYYGRPLTWPTEVIDSCRAASGDLKDIRLIQQAWSSSPEFPSAEEDLCLAYLGLIHGVGSFSHYAYRFGDRGTTQTLPLNEPEFWQGLRANTAHLAMLGKLNPPPADARVLLVPADGRSQWGLFERDGETVLLLCNPSNQPEWVRLGVPSPDGRITELATGWTIADQSEGGAWIEMMPEQVLTARVTGYRPEPVCEPLLPVTVEFPSFEDDVYQTVIVRSPVASLDPVRIAIAGSPATRTDLPEGVAVSRTVQTDIPLSRVLQTKGYFMAGLEHRGRHPLVQIQMNPNQISEEMAGWKIQAGFPDNADLAPGQTVRLVSSMTPPKGQGLESVDFEAWLPWQSEPARGDAVIINGQARGEIRFRIPDDADARAMSLSSRWIIKTGGETRDLWVSLPITTDPLINTVKVNPVSYHPRRMASAALIDVAGRFVQDTTVNMTLDVPEGWRVWMPSSPVVLNAADRTGTAAFTLNAPGDRFGRDEATLTFDYGQTRKKSVPVTLSVPLYAAYAEKGVDYFDPAIWEGVRAEKLETRKKDDLTGTLQLLWAESELTLRCEVRDNNHVPHTGEGGVWRGDSLQVSVLATPWRGRTPESGDAGFVNFGIACDAEGESVVKDFGFAPEGVEREQFLNSLKVQATRQGDRTTYTIVLPWEAFAADAETAREGASFALLINDYDNSEKTDRHWLEFGSGIVRGTDPYSYADLILADAR